MVGPISETVGFGPTNVPGGPKATAGAATRAIAAEATTATRAPPRGQRRGASWDTEDLDLISGSCPCDGHVVSPSAAKQTVRGNGQRDRLDCPDLILTRM